MRDLFYTNYREKLEEFYSGKVSASYAAVIVLFIFVATSSISISNYVISRLTFDLNPEDISIMHGEDTDDASSLSEVVVKKGDTLGKIFATQLIPNIESALIVKAIKKQDIEYTLKPGQVISFEYVLADKETGDVNNYLLKEINIELDKTRSIIITKHLGEYIVKDLKAALKRMYVKNEVTIKNSFTDSLSKMGVSASNIQELVNAYSYQVDFQRQIKSGDTISVIAEKYFTEDGDFAHNGKILYASLNLSGNKHNIYLFKESKSSTPQYYSETGKSVKRSLIRTPLNVAKVSSKFGNRSHPTLGYTKMHKGVDFSAPSGTPIYAAGDGVITDAGYRGAYGNIVKVKHSSSLTTAYAHASKFAKGVKAGTRVKQGQVIAYVGRTGRATGTHLHFEVIVNGKHVNPMNVQSTPVVELKKETLAAFNNHKKKIQNYCKELELAKPVELAFKE